MTSHFSTLSNPSPLDYGRLKPTTSSTPPNPPNLTRPGLLLILLAVGTLLILTSSIVALAAVRASSKKHDPARGPTTAIKKACGLTRYPDLCIASLVDFPGARSAGEPRQLAHISMNMTLREFGRALSSSTEIGNWGMGSMARSAYDDCLELLEDSMELLDNSLVSFSPATVDDDVDSNSKGVNESFEGDNVDYSQLFVTNQVFNSENEIWNWCINIALRNGFDLRKSSTKYVCKNKRHKALYWKCSRMGVYVPSPDKKRRSTATNKCNCMFNLVVREIDVEGQEAFGWVTRPKTATGYHNHRLVGYDEGHKRLSKFSPVEVVEVVDALRAHVPPGNILAKMSFSSPEKARNSLQQIYNLSQKVRRENQGVMSSAQYMLKLAGEANYVRHVLKDDENRTTHIFLAHPESIKLYQSYHGVVIMDSTYRTNKYNLPLVEFVGVTPVGMNFVIAYAILEAENEACYAWALVQLKKLLVDGVFPNVIITDRELGLIKAMEKVFNEPKPFLCTWHVNKAVLETCQKAYGSKQGQAIYHTYWPKISEAVNEDELTRHWNKFIERTPKLVDKEGKHYLNVIWLKHHRKFVKGYTNLVMHYGNTATSRVEASHALLKHWLSSSQLSLATLFQRFDCLLKQQIVEIRKMLEKSRTSHLHEMDTKLYSMLKCNVTHEAVILMCDEFERGTSLGIGLEKECGCTMRSTHGLPCACKLHDLFSQGDRVHLSDIDVFWKTLTYCATPIHDFAHLKNMFKIVEEGDDGLKIRIEKLLDSYLKSIP